MTYLTAAEESCLLGKPFQKVVGWHGISRKAGRESHSETRVLSEIENNENGNNLQYVGTGFETGREISMEGRR